MANPVDYAISQGIKRFAVFAPQTAYGDQMANTLQDEAAARGASVVGVEQFDPHSLDLTASAKRLAADTAGDSKVAILMPVAPPQLSSALASLSAADASRTVIETGLQPGESVVIDGVDRLRDGAEIRLAGAQAAAPAAGEGGERDAAVLGEIDEPPADEAGAAGNHNHAHSIAI